MAKKPKKLEIKKSVLDWCNEQFDNDHELSIHWEGGNDSGWCYFEIDGETVENEYTSYLVNRMYDLLDYGSWAGEFGAEGRAVYSKEEKAFVGIDYYSEDTHIMRECNIVIKVPKDLWYDNLSIHVDCDDMDSPTGVEVEFIVKNGFLSEKHDSFIESIEEHITKEVNETIYKMDEEDVYFNGLWERFTLTRSEGLEKDDCIEHTISQIEVRTRTSEEKDIYLEVSEESLIEI
jgi:hypothetical protein